MMDKEEFNPELICLHCGTCFYFKGFLWCTKCGNQDPEKISSVDSLKESI